jgi:hypothetical protein
MTNLYNISDWSEQPWWNTGGTRNKKVYLSPEDGELYYFKESFNKGQRDYKYEFWSEIVASEVGILMGFDVLKYDIAIRDDTVGCISKFMIDPEREGLVEGGKYLQAFDNSFEPENRKTRSKYDWQLILDSLEKINLSKFFGNIIETILFDAFIGNSDRHQENWATINVHSGLSKSAADFERQLENGLLKILPNRVRKFFEKIYLKSGKARPEFKLLQRFLSKGIRFAPIYDSGCSFGRELSDEKVIQLLSDDNELQKYLDNGLAEIHWENNKINHFELLEKILEDNDFQTMLLESMERILKKFDEKALINLIYNVDLTLKNQERHEGLPAERKALMIKLLTSRKERIEALYRRYRP